MDQLVIVGLAAVALYRFQIMASESLSARIGRLVEAFGKASAARCAKDGKEVLCVRK